MTFFKGSMKPLDDLHENIHRIVMERHDSLVDGFRECNAAVVHVAKKCKATADFTAKKAVEHKKDVDVAVKVGLSEIIPFLEDKSRPSSSSGKNDCLETPPPIAVACSEDANLMKAADSAEKQKGSSSSHPIDIDDNSSSSLVADSSQICSVELLQGIIDDARSSKYSLSSAMESTISLMGEVELKERAVEQAKLEASTAGWNLLSASEDLKKRSQLIKEANEKHTVEVFGDRVILASEMEELQLRLHSLSEEKDRSLEILNEIRVALLSKLSASAIEEYSAEKEKSENIEFGRRSLAEQELIMESLVQESKKLMQEAEENEKLREFLEDRGQVVDILQGEISVICQDVRLLKEKYDQGLTGSYLHKLDVTPAITEEFYKCNQSVADDVTPAITGEFCDECHQSVADDITPAISEEQLCDECKQLVADDKKDALEDGWESI